MASEVTPTEQYKKAEVAPPPPEVRAAPPPAGNYRGFRLAELVLRFLVLASSVVAVVVIVTGNQTEVVARIPVRPFFLSKTAKFTHSPAFIYFVAAHSVIGFYSIIATLVSFYALIKPSCSTKATSHFIIFDVLLLGVIASATGAAAAVAYIGLKGNRHVQWGKICGLYDSFCKHVGASLAVSLFGSVALALLILISVYSLSKRIPK